MFIFYSARRRRNRENTLEGVAHDDGLSSDDEETNSEIAATQLVISKSSSFNVSVILCYRKRPFALLLQNPVCICLSDVVNLQMGC